LIARPGSGVDFITAEPLVDVADEARLAVLAVIDHVDAELQLLVHDFADRFAQACGVAGLGRAPWRRRF
jgi:hypothetical protein